MFEAEKYQEALRNLPLKKNGEQQEIVLLKVKCQPDAQNPADSIQLCTSLRILRQPLKVLELLVKSHVAPNQKTLVKAAGRKIFRPEGGSFLQNTELAEFSSHST